MTVEIAPGPASIGRPSGMMPMSSFWMPSAFSTAVSRCWLRRAWTMSSALSPISTPPAILNAPMVIPKILKMRLPPSANAISVIAQLHALPLVRVRAEANRDWLAVPHDLDHDGGARPDAPHGGRDVGAIDDVASIDAHQLIAGAEAGQPRGTEWRNRAPAATLHGRWNRADPCVDGGRLGQDEPPAGRLQIIVPRNVVRAAHVQPPELRKVASRRAAYGLHELVPCEPVVAGVVLHEKPHDIVERSRVVGGVTNREIEEETQQLTLEIIGYVRTLVHSGGIPRGPGRPLRRDHHPRGIILEVLHRPREPAREIGGRVEPGPRQDEIGVVIGHALAPPEVDRTHFTFVVERPELNGADSLHIPGMEELVRADGLRAAWVTRQRLRGHPDSRGIQMLEAAAATADKDVGVVPIWCAAENE